MPQKPLCFVLMPFGKKSAGGARPIDFDAVYRSIIRPAIEQAGLEPLRADEEEAGGIIHKPMFERLVLCDFAVADLTAANANVFYELGVRHAAKPRTTVLMFAEGHGRLPFDVAQLRAIPYEIGRAGTPKNDKETIDLLCQKLEAAKKGQDKDSPLYQLLDDYPDVAREKTDVFRARVEYAADVKRRLAASRKDGVDALRQLETDLGPLADLEAGIVVDLFLSFRALKAWGDMIRVVTLLNPVIANTVLMREQLALAMNRVGRSEEAEGVLVKLLNERGPNSETLGILGRVFKDRWLAARADGEDARAAGLLRKAISVYRRGFEADWRDAYPGVNALTLLQISSPNSEDYKRLFPIVSYALERRMETGEPDYWDYATKLELAVLDGNQQAAEIALEDTLGHVREVWEPETTANNLRLLLEARGEADATRVWSEAIIQALEKAAKKGH